MSGDNLYVYGVMDIDDVPSEISTEGVHGASSVYTVENRRFAAIVSDIDTTEPERTDEDSRKHDDVLREIMEHGDGRTIVPMAYGMAFEGKPQLKNVLRSAAPSFRRALSEIDGAVELGIQVIEDADATVDAAVVNETVLERAEPLSIQHVENDRYSDRLICNRSFLVDRDDREAFDEAVETLRRDLEDVQVRYTGPWAPYNFVDVRIGAQR